MSRKDKRYKTPLETAKRYGIGQDPRNALVDVAVVRTDGSETVPAAVKVTASNLAGQTSHVKMQAISEAGRVSYLGVYKFAPDEVVDFDVLMCWRGRRTPTKSCGHRGASASRPIRSLE